MSELNGETGGIDRVDCAQLVDMAAELALGVLTGRERAAALAHLDGCPACSEYVRELTVTGEELLGLLPPHEPPAGFESRVLDRLGLAVPVPVPSHGTQRQGTQRQEAQDPGSAVLPLDRKRAQRAGGRRPGMRPVLTRTLVAAAVVVAAVGGALGGWALHSSTTSAPPPVSAAGALSSATLLTANHQTAGEIFLHNGSAQWMYAEVTMDSNPKTMMVLCQLETADGKVMTVGSFWLSQGYGSWGGPWKSNAKVTGARLVTPDGTVLASATF
jgi:Putative zinc-finger